MSDRSRQPAACRRGEHRQARPLGHVPGAPILQGRRGIPGRRSRGTARRRRRHRHRRVVSTLLQMTRDNLNCAAPASRHSEFVYASARLQRVKDCLFGRRLIAPALASKYVLCVYGPFIYIKKILSQPTCKGCHNRRF
jgi:hypothetical protein